MQEDQIRQILRRQGSQEFIDLFSETSLRDLLLVPFSNESAILSALNKRPDILPAIVQGNIANVIAARDYMASLIIEEVSKYSLDALRVLKEPTLVKTKYQQQQVLLNPDLLTSSFKKRLRTFEESQNKKLYGSRQSPLLDKVDDKQLHILANKSDSVLNYMKSKKVDLEIGRFKGIQPLFAYFQLKKKKLEQLLENVIPFQFKSFEDSRDPSAVIKYKGVEIKKFNPRNKKIELVPFAKLSQQEKYDYLISDTDKFELDDVTGIEIATRDFIPFGETPTPKTAKGIFRISNFLQQTKYIQIISSENCYVFSSKKPNTIKYAIVPRPEAFTSKQLQVPFPELLSINTPGIRLRTSFHLKTYFDFLDYHWGDNAHIIYKMHKKRFVEGLTRKELVQYNKEDSKVRSLFE